jgi:putative ABC transport system permease protein
MKLFDLDHWREIAVALGKNKLRTGLTAFGVFWGIFLLVVTLGSGTGLENGVTAGFRGTATNSFFLWTQRTSKPWRGMPPGRAIQMNNEDVVALRQQVPELEIVAPRNQLGGYMGNNNVSRGTKSGAFGVMGDQPEILRIEALDLVAGRFLNPYDLEERRKVAVIGTGVRDVLYAPGEDVLGTQIKVQGVYFKVVGMFKSQRSGDEAERENQAVYVPFTTFQQAFNLGNQVGWMAIVVRPEHRAVDIQEKVIGVLKERHKVAPDDQRAFGKWNMQEEYDQIQGLFLGIRALVWIVGLGTLAAGAIGVSNIMMIIVKERTSEIGLRRAIGATPWTVVGEIVLEAVLLTAVAGYLGLVAGVGVLELVSSLLPPPGSGDGPQMFQNPGVSFQDAMQAVAILVVSGTVAGLAAAQRAVRVAPVVALRSE